MIRDRNFRLAGILVMGILLTFTAGYPLLPGAVQPLWFVFSNYLLISFLSWQSCLLICTYLKKWDLALSVRILLGVLLAGGASLLITQTLVNAWASTWEQAWIIEFRPVLALVSICCTVIIVLCYEIIFLDRERIIDSQVVRHLDRELAEAEMNVLRNELDPHFVYNSLMPLYYLVKNDVPKAEAFACKLIQVYQYFLQNRQKDLVTLEEELQFIHNYFFLLRIRYKDAVKLCIQVEENDRECMVLPLCLQTLVENVIKHNTGNSSEPVEVRIFTRDKFLVVANSLHEQEAVPSSKVGLKNLRARYRLLSGKEISVTREPRQFVVELPLLSRIEDYDVRYCNRG